MKKWRVEDSAELYNINGWGVNYFNINEKGHVYVTPRKDGVEIDLKELMDELDTRNITAPVLLRFPDILDNRIEKTATCFQKAAKEYSFNAEHFIIYPIKVNQMRPVVEEIISHGKRYNIGLEAGSKPELHAVLATNMESDSPIICNGHKDQSYIELALLAQKMGKKVWQKSLMNSNAFSNLPRNSAFVRRLEYALNLHPQAQENGQKAEAMQANSD